jgi:hypothetical protein
MYFYLNNPKKEITGDDYGIFNCKQTKTEITKAIVNLIQMPADIVVDVNDTSIAPAEPEKPDQLTLKERLNLAIEQQKKLPSNDVDENKTKDLVKIIRREMDYVF